MMDDNVDDEIKIILLGEAGVGKTSIIKRFLNQEFDINENSSITMNYVAKELTINKKKIKLNIWDTIGQEKYRSLSKLFLSDTKIVILVYSIIVKQSFESLEYWHKLYTDNLGNDLVLGVAGNKCDLYLNEEVSEDTGREYAKQHNGIFGLLSAKENKESIDIFIENLVKKYLEKSTGGEVRKNIKLGEEYIGVDKVGWCSGNKKVRMDKYRYIKEQNNGHLNAIFLGGGRVGKTSLIKRICGAEFKNDEEHENGIKKNVVKYRNRSMNFQISIFDMDNDLIERKTDVAEGCNAIAPCKIFYIVFDLNDRETFNKVNYWIQIIKVSKEKKDDKSKFLTVIVGNKTDLNKYDKDIIEEARKIASDNKGIFLMTSALKKEGINQLICDSVENYLNLK